MNQIILNEIRFPFLLKTNDQLKPLNKVNKILRILHEKIKYLIPIIFLCTHLSKNVCPSIIVICIDMAV